MQTKEENGKTATLSDIRGLASLSRKTFGGGRPPGSGRKPVARCLCGDTTLSRALRRWPARGGKCPKCESMIQEVGTDSRASEG